MKKEELIKQCRYYKGEANSPYASPNLNWYREMERVFVIHDGFFEGESEYYKRIEGQKYPGIPFSLLMVMFTSWAKSAYDIKNSLPDFYKLVDDYLFIANDHYPEDKIPG